MQKLPSRRQLLPLLLPCGAVVFLFFLVQFLIRAGDTDRQFEAAAENFFAREISSSTINLHYTLADPASAGIREYPVTLGSMDLQGDTDPSLEMLTQLLTSYDPSQLNGDNRLVYRLLQDDLENREALREFGLLQEIISPSLGVQAQLPVLLCEYTFRTKQDILDYLGLLKEIPDYFSEILTFEQEKSRQGYFMNDAAVDGILEQCASFLTEPVSSSLLETVFCRKISAFEGLSQKEADSCLSLHTKLLETCVYPAYRSLMNGLEALKGTGRNAGGLCGFSEGRDYYCWLLRSQVGTSDSPEEIGSRLLLQLQADISEMQSLLPQIASPETEPIPDGNTQPEDILRTLQKAISADFPPLQVEDYEIKYVDDCLEDYLSPAFYLTPPADTSSPNAIYINRAASMQGIELFTTLAHEGFPGHLYQTVYFASTAPSLVRYLYEPGGYVEGWATYIESYAYSYADLDPALARLLWLNRSLNLCLYALMDLGIHYQGWTEADTGEFLSQAGITDAETTGEIYQYIVETPANYLKYYYGCLNFMDIREAVKLQEGDAFDLKTFHQELLELGPMPFYILEEELGI